MHSSVQYEVFFSLSPWGTNFLHPHRICLVSMWMLLKPMSELLKLLHFIGVYSYMYLYTLMSSVFYRTLLGYHIISLFKKCIKNHTGVTISPHSWMNILKAASELGPQYFLCHLAHARDFSNTVNSVVPFLTKSKYNIECENSHKQHLILQWKNYSQLSISRSCEYYFLQVQITRSANHLHFV